MSLPPDTTIQFPLKDEEKLPLTIGPLDTWVDFLIQQIDLETGRGLILFTLNLDHWYRCRRSESFYRIYQQADFIVPDGWPISESASRLVNRPVERVPGVELAESLIRKMKPSHRLYLLGARPGVIERAARQIWENLEFKGEIQFHHGYFEEDEKIVEELKTFRPHVLLVGMGSPRQEEWLVRHRMNNLWGLGIAVGGALDVLAGVRKRAPIYIQKVKLEWFYRWLQRPITLSRRYLIDGPRAYITLKQEVRRWMKQNR